MYTPADVSAAIYAREIDQLADQWSMTADEAIAFLNEQELVIAQPTTISAAKRAPGLQLSLFDALEQPEADLLPNRAKYRAGKELLAHAYLTYDRKRRQLGDLATIKHGGLFYCLRPRIAQNATK